MATAPRNVVVLAEREKILCFQKDTTIFMGKNSVLTGDGPPNVRGRICQFPKPQDKKKASEEAFLLRKTHNFDLFALAYQD
jgi:hypothetical protein